MNERTHAVGKEPDIEAPVTCNEQRPGTDQALISTGGVILNLQKTIGNRAVQRLLQSGVIQPELQNSESNSTAEPETMQVSYSKRIPIKHEVGTTIIVRQSKPKESPIPTKDEIIVELNKLTKKTYSDFDDYWDKLGSTTFLGKDVTKVHQELIDMLKNAEKLLTGQKKSIKASDWGIQAIAGCDGRKGDRARHGWGYHAL